MIRHSLGYITNKEYNRVHRFDWIKRNSEFIGGTILLSLTVIFLAWSFYHSQTTMYLYSLQKQDNLIQIIQSLK